MFKKILKFAGLILPAFFISCSNSLDDSSVSFSLSNSAVRSITSESSGNWNLKISLSGDINQEKSFSIEKDALENGQSFLIEGLESSSTVNVDVSVWCSEVQYYEAKEKKSVVLQNKENSVDVVLERNISSASVSAKKASDTLIGAVDSDGKIYTYISTLQELPALPYTTQIAFTLADGSSSGNYAYNSYEWYLNGEKLENDLSIGQILIKNSATFELAKTDSVVLSTDEQTNVNSLVCIFGTESEYSSAEFKFLVTAE